MNNNILSLKSNFILLMWVIILASAGCINSESLTGESKRRDIVETTIPVALVWMSELENPVRSQPVSSENIFIIPTADSIYAIHGETGEKIWEHVLEAPQSISHVPLDSALDLVIFGDIEGRVTALDLENGKVIWQHEVSSKHNYGHKVNDILLRDGLLYVAYQPTFIEALDAETGNLIWNLEGIEYEIPDRGANLFFDPREQELIVITVKAFFLDKTNGELIHILEDRPENINRITQLSNGKLYGAEWVYNIDNGRGYQILQDDKSADSCPFVQPYLFYEDRYFAANKCGGIYALAQNDNQILWQYRTDLDSEAPMAIHDGLLYVMLDNGEIHAIKPDSGVNAGVLITSSRLPGSLTNANFTSRGITSNGSTLIVTFNDENVWGFR